MRRSNGFSFFEIMTVLAIIGLLAAIAIPMYQNYTAKTRVAQAVVILQDLKKEFLVQASNTGFLPASVGGIAKGDHKIGTSATPDIAWIHYNDDGNSKVWFSIRFNEDALPFTENPGQRGAVLHLGGTMINGEWVFRCGRWGNHGSAILDDWLTSGCNDNNLDQLLDDAARAAGGAVPLPKTAPR